MSFPSTKQGSNSGAPVIGHRAPAHPPSDMSISESFITIWNVFMSVRDAYAESRGSGVPKRDVTFEKIVEFMLQNRRANSEVLGLLERFLGSSHTSYSDKEVTAYLCTSVQGPTQYFRQVYRYVALFDEQDGSKDRRVRDFYEWTIDGRGGGGTGMVQRVFNNDIFKRYFHGAATGKGRGTFRTVPATRFQQLLYLSVVKHIEIERTGRERKRRLGHGKKVKAVKYVESFTISNHMHGQRMAYGVQHVCRAWDAFDVVLGFRDCEQMMLPYLLINRDTFKLSDIHSRTIGYSPKNAAYKLGQEMKPTVSEDSVVTWAIAFSDDVDCNMRILARELVSDLRRIVLDKKMYELSETEQWPVLSTFTRSSTNPPVRFDSLSEDIVKSVKEACPKHNVQPSKAWSRPMDVHSKLSAAPGTKSHTKSVQAVGKQLRESSNGSGQTNGSGSSSDDVITTPTAPASAEIQATVDVSVNILPPHGTLGPVTAKATKILESVMEKNFAFYCVDSEELVYVHENVPGGTISPRGRVQLSISDAPYQIRDTEYDRIGHQKMVSFAYHNSDCLRPVGHLFVFCSGFQFPIWYKILTDCQYVDAEGRMKKSFTVDKTSLLCLRHRSNPMAFPGRNNISLFPAREQVLHAVRNGIPYAEQKTMVNYRKFNHVASRYPGHVGVIDQVPHRAPGERLYWKVRDGQRFVNRQIRPEQKSRQLMKELIARFSQPGDLVMDFFSGTFTTALACMELVPHRKLIGGENYRNCFIHAKHNGIVLMGKVIADNSLKVGDLECDERIGTNAVVQAALHVAMAYEEQMKEAEEKLLPKDERGDPILCAWRLSGLDRICFSGYDVSSRKYGEELDDLYFKNELRVEVLREFMGYDAERPCRERETSYVDGSVMHLARLDAWIASVVEALKEDVGRGGKRQMLFSKLYAKYLPLAVEDILLTARRKIEGKYGKELVNYGVKAEDPTEVEGNEEREGTVACWMPSNQLVYLGVPYEVFLDEMTTYLGNVFDCYVGRCMPEEREFKELVAVEEEILDPREEGEGKEDGEDGGRGEEMAEE